MNSSERVYDVIVVGAGSVGVSVAWHLLQKKSNLRVALIDRLQPLSLTSAASGENYRNWWPHPTMKAFMDRSMDILVELEQKSGQQFISTDNGYLLATRDANPEQLIRSLETTYLQPDEVRFHESAESYRSALAMTDGVDIVMSRGAVARLHPGFDPEIQSLIHIRRGGSIATQLLGSHMLSEFKSRGGHSLSGEVVSIERGAGFSLCVSSDKSEHIVRCGALVNCAGPFSQALSRMLDITLPIDNVLQQKIAFDDTRDAIDRDLPFCIDLDSQFLNWSTEDREAILQDSELSFLGKEMQGSIHCRPDGPRAGKRIKLGWAYNSRPGKVRREPLLDDHFPEVVLRGAARLHPSLSVYYDGFPKQFSHYGGYYTLTEENWPLIGETDVEGFFVATAMSGFGSMAACAAGELATSHVLGESLPSYAKDLSLRRYQNTALMDELMKMQSRGIL